MFAEFMKLGISSSDLDKLLSAKKATYLKAINKLELIDFEFSDIDSTIQIPPKMNFSFNKPDDGSVFDDSIVVRAFESFNKPKFSLDLYLKSVKAFLLDYTGSQSIGIHEMSDTYIYILAHARDFDDPSTDMLQFMEVDSNELKEPQFKNIQSALDNHQHFIRLLRTLIEQLNISYTEEKYRRLNVNVTYLLLVAVRSLVKGYKQMNTAFATDNIHKIYKDLCPLALQANLPTISKNCSMFNAKILRDQKMETLLLYAFKTKQHLTKRILNVTCMQYFKYMGLQFYETYNKVVELYGLNEKELWDHLYGVLKMNHETLGTCMLECICTSLVKLADFEHEKHEGELSGKSYELFPYCRLLNNKHYMSLSARHNPYITYTLSCMIDMQLGMTKSFMREAAWTNQRNTVFAKHLASNLAASVKISIEKK